MPDFDSDVDNNPRAIALSIAGVLQYLGNGDLADLRRLDEYASAPAYWRLAARHEVLAQQPVRWTPIVKALAILSPKGSPGERAGLHDGKRKLGTVLCDGGVDGWPGVLAPGQSPRPILSERRLAQLLASRGSQRVVLLTRAVRALATGRDSRLGIDVGDIAWAFLRVDDAGAIAGPYYKRLDRAPNGDDEASKSTPDA